MLITGSHAYRFCRRCWLPLAPIRRCRCAPDSLPPAEATPALLALAEAVQRGGYADDRACREQRWLGWLCWLVAYQRIGGAADGE